MVKYIRDYLQTRRETKELIDEMHRKVAEATGYKGPRLTVKILGKMLREGKV